MNVINFIILLYLVLNVIWFQLINRKLNRLLNIAFSIKFPDFKMNIEKHEGEL
jgi:hypothetical protein